MWSWWAVAAVLCLPCGLSYHVERLYEDVAPGQTLVLPCDGSAFRDQEGVVHWEQLGETLVVLKGGETVVLEPLKGRVQLPSEEQIREGNWSLVISSVMPSDDDVYRCILNNSTVISSVWVRVAENDEAKVVEDWTEKALWTTDGSGVGTTDFPTMEASTQTMKVETDSLLVGTTDDSTPLTDFQSIGTTVESTPLTDSQSVGTTHETTPLTDFKSIGTTKESTPLSDSQLVGTTDKSTPFPAQDDPKVTTDSPLLESLPWVRIGLIGGVLLVTLLVMGLLGALRQI